jgi:hypothetical protein
LKLDSTPEELLHWLIENRSMFRSTELTDTAVKPGLTCTVFTPNQQQRAILQKEYWIDSSLILWCDLEKFYYPDDGLNHLDQLIQLALSLLVWKQKPGELELVLYSVGTVQQIILLRQNNQNYVDCTDPDWEKIWNSAFGKARLPFTHRKLPSFKMRTPDE